MHFLRSSSVCVLPRYIFQMRSYQTTVGYIDVNGIAPYRIAYKDYVDVSYKLNIPPSPRNSLFRTVLNIHEPVFGNEHVQYCFNGHF